MKSYDEVLQETENLREAGMRERNENWGVVYERYAQEGGSPQTSMLRRKRRRGGVFQALGLLLVILVAFVACTMILGVVAFGV